MYFKRWRDFFHFSDADGMTFFMGDILPIGLWGAFLGVPLGMGPDALMLFWMLIPLVGFHELVHGSMVNSKDFVVAKYRDEVQLVDLSAEWWPLSRLSLSRRMKLDFDALEGGKNAMPSVDNDTYKRLVMLGHIKQHRAESQRARRVALFTIFVLFPVLLAALWFAAPMVVTAIVTTFALPAPAPMLIAIPIAFSLSHLVGRLSYGFGLFLTEDSRQSTHVDEWMGALVDKACQEKSIPLTPEFRSKVLAIMTNDIFTKAQWEQLTSAIKDKKDSAPQVESALSAIDQAVRRQVEDAVVIGQPADVLDLPPPPHGGGESTWGEPMSPLGMSWEADDTLPLCSVSSV